MEKIIKLVLIAITIVNLSVNAKETLVFGICPHDSGPTKVKRWYVLADYLSKKLGKKVIVSEDFTFDDFIKKFSNGEYDFVYINPMHYVVAHNLQGYTVFAKEKDRKVKEL
jgi:phosphonate transport system substrate-binding protein